MPKQDKVPSFDDAERCFKIRCRSKRGEYTSPEDSDFCAKMYKKYPDWYGSINLRVWNETRPFGAPAREE